LYIASIEDIKVIPEKLRRLFGIEDKDINLSKIEDEVVVGGKKKFQYFGIELSSKIIDITKKN
jgi:bifunctional DNA-binding transcriptional regulator/antitoxin component of YhaV-PrlF toxin-antitoxin module